MKNAVALYIISCSLLVFCVVTTISAVSQMFITQDKRCEKVLGRDVIIGIDTLKVVDYSLFEERFILSDGTKVNSNLILRQHRDSILNLNNR